MKFRGVLRCNILFYILYHKDCSKKQYITFLRIKQLKLVYFEGFLLENCTKILYPTAHIKFGFRGHNGRLI